MTGGVPLTIALVAGGLSTLNPCSFPLLPAFLSFYVGTPEERLPPAANRILQGLIVGLSVTLGYLAVFAVVGLPISYGVRVVADALPWLGAGVGVVLALAGALVLAGHSPSFTPYLRTSFVRERRLVTMVLFGAAYGAASLGCALPLFLALVGTSLSAQGEGGASAVFLAFGAGIALMLTAVSVAAALAREGLTARLRRLVPYVTRMAGGLLVLAGCYLTYYWLRLELGSNATLAEDPIVGFGTRFTARLQTLAAGEGELVVLAAGLIVLVAVAWSVVSLRRDRSRSFRARALPPPTRGGE